MGCHPKPIDELHHFSRWLLHHQPVEFVFFSGCFGDNGNRMVLFHGIFRVNHYNSARYDGPKYSTGTHIAVKLPPLLILGLTTASRIIFWAFINLYDCRDHLFEVFQPLIVVGFFLSFYSCIFGACVSGRNRITAQYRP